MKTKQNLVEIAMLIAMLLTALTASATTRVVSSLGDSGTGTLRDTIAASAANDTIVFSVSGTITLTSGELVITRNLTITGPGATNLTINANFSSRIFQVGTVIVNISGLSLTEGAFIGSDGIPNMSQAAAIGSEGMGGGILNYGELSLVNCYMYNNAVGGGEGATFGSNQGGDGGDGLGGAIANEGTLALMGCSFYNNESNGGNGAGTSETEETGHGGYGYGGAIANIGVGPVLLTNCTFNSNTAQGGIGSSRSYGGAGIGGAIYNDGGPVTMVNCTVSQNLAWGGDSYYVGGEGFGYGGGVTFYTPVSLLNTIIAGNNELYGENGDQPGVEYPSDVGPLTNASVSLGHNLIGVNTSGVNAWLNSDLTGTYFSPLNPQLGPWQYNGGPTPTLALLPNSPAIDAGDDAVLSAPYNLTTDQRGAHRPGGSHVDIGAYEFGGNTLLVTTFADSGLGSLRQAIASASDGDRITFTPLILGTIGLTSGELLISQELNIVGPGATNLIISGNLSSRVFHVSSSGSLNLYGLTLANGSVKGANGAPGSPGADGEGGGLLDEGSASLFDCVITNCHATGGNAGGPATDFAGKPGGNGAGGGSYNSGLLSLLRCTVSGNSVQGGLGGTGSDGSKGGPATEKGGTGGAAFGAGLANTGVLFLTNCTLAENVAIAGAGGTGGKPSLGFGGAGGLGGSAHGAGVSQDSGTATMTSCTISGNQSIAGNGGAGAGGGGTLGPGGANSGGVFSAGNVQLQNCLIAENQATNNPDVNGTVNSGGFNLIGIADGSTGWLVSEEANLGNSSFPINPMLGPLQNNDGTTATMALLTGSPAIDQGDSFGLTTDQRGSVRPSDNGAIANASGGDGSDIGAYEVAFIVATPATLSSVVSGNNQFQFLLTGQPGASYAIQASTNLAVGNWISLYTNTSPFTFVDSNANHFQVRFYRGVSSP